MRRTLNLRRKIAFLCGYIVALLLVADALVMRPWLIERGFLPEGESEVCYDRHPAAAPDNVVPHSRHLWHYEPGSRRAFDGEGRTCIIETNSQGWRDEEPAQHTAPWRFLAVGDSFTFGWLVSPEERWDEVLGKSLGADSLNVGMWMSTFDQHALIAEDHLDGVKLVIHGIYPSHLQTINRRKDVVQDGRITEVVDPVLYVDEAQHKLLYKLPRPWVWPVLRWPYSLCLLDYRRRVQDVREEFERTYPGVLVDEQEIYHRDGQAAIANGWRLTELAIRQTARACQERGIPYVVVLIPRSFQLWREAPAGIDAGIPTTQVPQERLAQICAEAGAKCLDLLPAMRAWSGEPLYFTTDPHWTPAGHRLAASEIARFLGP